MIDISQTTCQQDVGYMIYSIFELDLMNIASTLVYSIVFIHIKLMVALYHIRSFKQENPLSLEMIVF